MQRICREYQAPPTNPSVATQILPSGGKTERSATKQAPRVEPIANTLYSRNVRIACFSAMCDS